MFSCSGSLQGAALSQLSAFSCPHPSVPSSTVFGPLIVGTVLARREPEMTGMEPASRRPDFCKVNFVDCLTEGKKVMAASQEVSSEG